MSSHGIGGQASVGSALSALVDQYGPALFNDPPRLRSMLTQACENATGEIAAVIAALQAEVPQRLLESEDDAMLAELLPKLVDGVAAQPGVDRTAATRAVRSWALALALPADVLARTRPVISRPAALPSSFAAVVTPLAARPAPPAVAVPQPLPDPEPPAAPPPVVAIVPEPGPAEPSRTPAAGSAAPAPVQASSPVVESIPAQAPPPQRAPPVPIAPRAKRAAPWRRVATTVVLVVVLAGAFWWHGPPATGPVAALPVDGAVGGRLEAPPTTVSSASPPTMPAVGPEPVNPSQPAAVAEPPANAPSPVPTPAAIPVAPAASTPPAAVASPSIARIDVPVLAAGQAFDVRLFVEGTPGAVAAVEERFVDPATGRSASRVIPARTLARSGKAGFVVPVRALATVARVEMDFTLVDRAGGRSPPRRIVFEPTAQRPPKQPVAIAATPVPCTRSTCGSVVSARDIGTGAIEAIVRMDDRSIQTVRVPSRPVIGTRLRRVGERFVPAGGE